MGFEPTVPIGYDGFQDRSVMTASVSLHTTQKIYYHTLKWMSRLFAKAISKLQITILNSQDFFKTRSAKLFEPCTGTGFVK